MFLCYWSVKVLYHLTILSLTILQNSKGEPQDVFNRSALLKVDVINSPYVVQNHYALKNHIQRGSEEDDDLDGNKVLDAKVFCDLRANVMTVELRFAKKFTGYAYTKGYYKVNECKAPGEGIEALAFSFPLDGCGTTIRSQGEFRNSQVWYQNTVIVMYETYLGILESYDRSFDLRCELDDKVKKVASHVTVPMLASKAIGYKLEMPNVWMKLVSGKDPASPPTPYLTIGEIGTMVIVMENQSNRFDFFAFQCSAHDGSGKSHVILLNDIGCPIHRKLVGPQQYDKLKSLEMVSFTHFKVFKFPDVENVYMECFVKICFQKCLRERCLDDNGYSRRHKRDMGPTTLKSISTTLNTKYNETIDVKTYQSVSVLFPGSTYSTSREDEESELIEVSQTNGTARVAHSPSSLRISQSLVENGNSLTRKDKVLISEAGDGVHINPVRKGICFSFLPFVVFVSVHSGLFIISASFAIFLSIRFKLCASLLKTSSSADLNSMSSQDRLLRNKSKFSNAPTTISSPQISYVRGPLAPRTAFNTSEHQIYDNHSKRKGNSPTDCQDRSKMPEINAREGDKIDDSFENNISLVKHSTTPPHSPADDFPKSHFKFKDKL